MRIPLTVLILPAGIYQYSVQIEAATILIPHKDLHIKTQNFKECTKYSTKEDINNTKRGHPKPSVSFVVFLGDSKMPVVPNSLRGAPYAGDVTTLTTYNRPQSVCWTQRHPRGVWPAECTFPWREHLHQLGCLKMDETDRPNQIFISFVKFEWDSQRKAEDNRGVKLLRDTQKGSSKQKLWGRRTQG